MDSFLGIGPATLVDLSARLPEFSPRVATLDRGGLIAAKRGGEEGSR